MKLWSRFRRGRAKGSTVRPRPGAGIVRAARTVAFVWLSSVIMVMASERVYWTLGGLSLGTLVETPAFYAIPATVGLLTMAVFRARRLEQMVLVGAVYAFIVEGVLTAVVYQDGFLPILALLFVGWHGMLAFVGFWYLLRRWLLARRRGRIVVASTLVGLYWGAWSMTWTLPEALDANTLANESVTLLPPGSFLGYALVVGAVLAVAHWLIGFVWPDRWIVGRWAIIGVAVVVVGYFALSVLPVVPWAPAKLVVLVGAVMVLLWRARRGHPLTATAGASPGASPGASLDASPSALLGASPGASPDASLDASPGAPLGTMPDPSPDAVASLAGQVRLGDALLVLTGSLVAALVYGAIWMLAPSDAVVRVLSAVLTAAQVAAGVVALVWATLRILRPASREETRGVGRRLRFRGTSTTSARSRGGHGVLREDGDETRRS